MINRIVTALYLLAISVLFPVPVYAYDFLFGESAYLEFKGDLTYSAKYRMEGPDSDLKEESSGNSNFENGDIVNNKAIARMETTFDAPYVTFFGKFEAFYDDVYTDDELYPEGTNIDLAKDHAAKNVVTQEFYIDLHSDRVTLRTGKQVVEWGEMAAPIFAPGVNVMNKYDGTKVGAAGYTLRDYKVPAESAWLIAEVTPNLSVEAIYSQDFEPRATMSVVGTYGNFLDILGYGGPTVYNGLQLEEVRPKSSDMEQYGVASKLIMPSLGNLELGLYYSHYIDMFPMIDAALPTSKVTYEEVNMYGVTLARVVNGWSVYGEFTYRPDQAAQIAWLPTSDTLNLLFIASLADFDVDGAPIGGSKEVRTFNWGVGAMKIYSDFFSSLPWTIQFMPMIEFYGGNNLDYDDDLDGQKGQLANFLAVDLAYDVPEHTAYYMANFTLNSSDMIDNTAMSLTMSFTGALHNEEKSFHSIGTTLNARIGDNLGLMLGYDVKIGEPGKAAFNDYPGNVPDRDALTLGATWYFM